MQSGLRPLAGGGDWGALWQQEDPPHVSPGDGDLLANPRMRQVRGGDGPLGDRIKIATFLLVLVTKAKAYTYVLKVLGSSAGW